MLNQAQLQEALVQRHREGKSFPGRDLYIGASEIGGCQRVVAWRKLHPEEAQTFSLRSVAVMRTGQVLENELVQCIRIALPDRVRATGANQMDLQHESAPIRCHPDAVILATKDGVGVPAGTWIMDESGQVMQIEEALTGNGNGEFKTSSEHGIKNWLKKGLNPSYYDQTQIQMGLGKLLWSMLVAGARENLSFQVVFTIKFNPDHYEGLVEKARRTMEQVDKIRQGLITEAAGLPDGDTERGYCSDCPLFDECPAYANERNMLSESVVLPADVMADAEALTEEYIVLKPEAARFESVKDSLKELLQTHGAATVHVNGTAVVSLSPRAGRETVDGKSLKAKHPGIYSEFATVGDAYNVLSVKPPKKEGSN